MHMITHHGRWRMELARSIDTVHGSLPGGTHQLVVTLRIFDLLDGSGPEDRGIDQRLKSRDQRSNFSSLVAGEVECRLGQRAMETEWAELA